jgi:chromosome segregation ATPase
VKNLQQNLLIIVALSLCCLCVYQWYGQTLQRNEIQTLDQLVYEKSAAIQGYTNSIKTMDRQIAEMDARLTELKTEVKTNAEVVVAQKREINQLRIDSEGLTNDLSQYKGAVTNLQTKLKEAYEGIQKQNEAMKELVAQRDEFVKKFNDEVKDRNEIVNKYNELVRQVEKNQAASTKQ